MNPTETYSVSQLNRQVRALLETNFNYVWVDGEISNLARPASGHWYFSLKDDKAQVRCAMFRGHNQRLKIQVANGDAVRVRARVSLYEGRGEFQLIAEHIEPAGAGALQAAFEACKAKLQAEGLFDPIHKKPLAEHIRSLGIITSATGAAVHDILTVMARRFPGIEIFLLPVAVQGEQAAMEIITAIKNANHWQRQGKCHLDVLIIGRGGGSLEDLQAFNQEAVARAIFDSRIPVVSAVGHEVDLTIADMVADVRAPTPSAAAELVSPDGDAILANLAYLEERVQQLIDQRLDYLRTHLLLTARALQHPRQRLREQMQRLDDIEQRLLSTQSSRLKLSRENLRFIQGQLRSLSPGNKIRDLGHQLSHLHQQLITANQHRLEVASEGLSYLAKILDSLSPLATLNRGFAVVSDPQGHVVSGVERLAAGDRLSTRLRDGVFECDVVAVNPLSTSPEDGY